MGIEIMRRHVPQVPGCHINLPSLSSGLPEYTGNISSLTLILIYKSERRHLPEDCDVELLASAPSARDMLTCTNPSEYS